MEKSVKIVMIAFCRNHLHLLTLFFVKQDKLIFIKNECNVKKSAYLIFHTLLILDFWFFFAYLCFAMKS